jgi:hypothetical protein
MAPVSRFRKTHCKTRIIIVRTYPLKGDRSHLRTWRGPTVSPKYAPKRTSDKRCLGKLLSTTFDSCFVGDIKARCLRHRRSSKSADVLRQAVRSTQGLTFGAEAARSEDTRHTVFPKSSAISDPPSRSTASPTGRPRAWLSEFRKPVTKSSAGPLGLPPLNGTNTTL